MIKEAIIEKDSIINLSKLIVSVPKIHLVGDSDVKNNESKSSNLIKKLFVEFNDSVTKIRSFMKLLS